MIRVVLADDQRLVRQGIQLLLELEGDLRVVAVAGNGEECLAAVEHHRPEVVLMDLHMPVLDGTEATRQIAERFPDVAVIILTTLADRDSIVGALRAGARGYLLKDAESEELARAVRIVAAGGALLQPSVTRTMLEALARPAPDVPTQAAAPPPVPAGAALTEREREVLRLVAEGLTDGEIAARLYLSPRTVGQHLRAVYNKLGVASRSAATRRALDERLI